MRKIVHRTSDHNIVYAAALFVIMAMVLVSGPSGCGEQEQTDASPGHDQDTSASRDCRITVNIRPWTVFAALTEPLAAGRSVPVAELKTYGELPAVTIWRRSPAANNPSAEKVAKWLEGAWWEELGHQNKQKLNVDRMTLGRSYRFSQGHAQQIESQLAEFTDGVRACEIRELADAWLEPGLIPSPLVLNFLPAMAEIRIAEGELFVDTGVLRAGGSAQTVRQIVSLLYRDLAALPGPSPLEVSGEEAVAQCLRVIMNEGVAGWIEQTTRTDFGSEHPSLAQVKLVPEEFYRKAQQTTDRFESRLPEMLADPVVMAANGRDFARALAASGAYGKMGFVMADVIVAHLGEERLRQVRRSVPDFFAAYQEAALRNPTPVPEPGTAGIALYESARGMEPAMFEALHQLLVRHFAAG